MSKVSRSIFVNFPLINFEKKSYFLQKLKSKSSKELLESIHLEGVPPKRVKRVEMAIRKKFTNFKPDKLMFQQL